MRCAAVANASPAEISVWDNSDGLTDVFGRLFRTDAYAHEAQLEALAATVCPDDPRTMAQRIARCGPSNIARTPSLDAE